MQPEQESLNMASRDSRRVRMPVVEDDGPEGVTHDAGRMTRGGYRDVPITDDTSVRQQSLTFAHSRRFDEGDPRSTLQVYDVSDGVNYPQQPNNHFTWVDKVRYHAIGMWQYPRVYWKFWAVALGLVLAFSTVVADEDGELDQVKEDLKNVRSRHHFHGYGGGKNRTTSTAGKNGKTTVYVGGKNAPKSQGTEVSRVASMLELLNKDCPCVTETKRDQPYVECVQDATNMYKKMDFMTEEEQVDFLKIANLAHCDAFRGKKDVDTPLWDNAKQAQEDSQIKAMEDFKELMLFVEGKCPCLGPSKGKEWLDRSEYSYCAWKQASEYFHNNPDQMQSVERDQAFTALTNTDCGGPVQGGYDDDYYDDDSIDDDDNDSVDDDDIPDDTMTVVDTVELVCPCLGPNRNEDWENEAEYLKCVMGTITIMREEADAGMEALDQTQDMAIKSKCGMPSMAAKVEALIPKFEETCPCVSKRWLAQRDYWDCMSDKANAFWDAGFYHNETHVLEEVIRVAFSSACGSGLSPAGTTLRSQNTPTTFGGASGAADPSKDLAGWYEFICPCDGPTDHVGKKQDKWNDHDAYMQCVVRASLELKAMNLAVGEKQMTLFNQKALKSTCGSSSTSSNPLDDITQLLMELEPACPCDGKNTNTPWADHAEYKTCIERAANILFSRSAEKGKAMNDSEQAKMIRATTLNQCGDKSANTFTSNTQKAAVNFVDDQTAKENILDQFTTLMVDMERECPCAHPKGKPFETWPDRTKYVACMINAMADYFDDTNHVSEKVDDMEMENVMEAVLDNRCAKN
eukprot:scaffold64021_cov58-Attheya_sp.AAC.3